MREKILCVLPVYNEEKNIKLLLEKLLNQDIPIDVMIIDDGCKDNTLEVVNEFGVKVISHHENLGIGSAMQTGYIYAYENNYTHVIRLDGDGQHNPGCIEKFIQKFRNDEADMIIGSRFLEDCGYKYSMGRKIVAKYFAVLIALMTKLKITDPTSGYIGVNLKVLNQFVKYFPSDYPEIETIILISKHGFRIKEVPAVMTYREYGKSTITFFKSIYYVIKVTLAMLTIDIERIEKR